MVFLSFLHAKQLLSINFVRKSTNMSIVEIDPRQLYPYSMCQQKPVGLITRCDLNPERTRLTPRQNKTRSFENMVMSYFQLTRRDCKIESFYTTETEKIDCFSVDRLCSHCSTVFETMGRYYHFFPFQEVHPSFTEDDIQRGTKKRELDELRRNYIQEKGLTVIERWECEPWRLYKTSGNVKKHIPENIPYRRSLATEQL